MLHDAKPYGGYYNLAGGEMTGIKRFASAARGDCCKYPSQQQGTVAKKPAPNDLEVGVDTGGYLSIVGAFESCKFSLLYTKIKYGF